MDAEDRLLSALPAAATTRDLVIAVGGLAALPAVLRRVAVGRRLVVVADDSTWRAAGERAASLLAAEKFVTVEPVRLAGRPRVKPDAAIARELGRALKDNGALPLAVGAGVINDLVKYAAELAGTAYVSVPTAASMDGYAASGAALRDGGFKRTMVCAAPIAVVADLDIVATAPAAMAGWGYGDLLGKLIAGADWMLADALGVEALNPGPFALVQDNLASWLADPAELRRGDRAALGRLMRGLVTSGLAMQAHGNSRPASGSDHQFAHLWEMEELAVGGLPVSHGVCVGIGCLSMLAAYEWLQRQDVSRIVPRDCVAALPSAADLRAEIATAFPLAFMSANAELETAAKDADPQHVENRLVAFQEAWPSLAAKLSHRLPAPHEVRRWLDAAGAPSHAAAIGVSAQRHAADYARARLIRRRYTVLDLLHESGWLRPAVADLFGPQGFWRDSRAVA
jgi:glycerol-1-phosphate dehydrogenase [NAD(P)+]